MGCSSLDNASSKSANPAWIFRASAVFLLTSLYLYWFVRVLQRIGDEGILVYGAELAAGGALPYRDFFQGLGPLSFYWLALFFKLFGTQLIVARGLVLLTGAVTAVLIYWMTRRLYRGPYDFVPALFYTLLSIPLWPATSHHWDSNLFALLAFGAYLLWQDSKRFRYLFVAGLIAGLVSCFIQQKGLFMLVAFLALESWEGLRCRKEKPETALKLAVVLSGYASIGVLVILFFYLAGGLKDLVYATLLWPLSNYHEVNTVPYGYSLWGSNWPRLLAVFHLFLPLRISQGLSFFSLIPLLVIAALPFLTVFMGVVACLDPEKREQILDSRTLPYWLAGIALWMAEAQRMDIMHLIYGAPLLLIMISFLWKVLTGGRAGVWRLALGLLTSSLVIFGMLNLVVVSTAATKLATRRGNIYAFREDTALRFLLERTAPGEEVFVYPYYPMYYFLASVRNPTRFSSLYYHFNTEAQFAEVIGSLERKKVKYVLWDTVVEGANLKKWFPNYVHPAKEALRLERYLETHYRVLGIENGFRILERCTNNDASRDSSVRKLVLPVFAYFSLLLNPSVI